ncbi:hypothetical protein EVAR_75667_1 [Eumeta japonica]|uniref:Uncharacterized protein n=1 Tax=Eumeta variegata TaxID=151549 RepID=A0A4C1U051_EUMVA|nr:hypothetical protein EVAR_75667_1 [Eumeta japonica]
MFIWELAGKRSRAENEPRRGGRRAAGGGCPTRISGVGLSGPPQRRRRRAGQHKQNPLAQRKTNTNNRQR